MASSASRAISAAADLFVSVSFRISYHIVLASHTFRVVPAHFHGSKISPSFSVLATPLRDAVLAALSYQSKLTRYILFDTIFAGDTAVCRTFAC